MTQNRTPPRHSETLAVACALAIDHLRAAHDACEDDARLRIELQRIIGAIAGVIDAARK